VHGRGHARRVSGARALAVLAAGLLAWLGSRACERPPAPPGSLDDAIARRLVDVWVEGEGRVRRLLEDDREGVPHQRLLVDVGRGRTVLVVHNLDVAERVPAREGDEVRFRGEFQWNERGGLVHWTHRDPEGRREGGFVRHAGKDYR